MKPGSKLFDVITLFSLLVIIYSFFYSGTFTTDDEHILSSRALSFAFEGDFNISRVLGNGRIFEYSILPEQWSEPALNIEPAQPVSASILALISTFLNLGRVQTMFLLNIWVTAATAVFVYLSATKMGFSRGVSFIVTAFFALGTIVMPYSRTFFRDSLAMFFLAAAFTVSLLISQSNRQNRADHMKIALLWLTFLGLTAAGVMTKNSVILVLPIMLLEIVLRMTRKRSGVKRKITPGSWLIPLGLIASLVLCWVLIVPAFPMLTRFSLDYYFSLLQKFLSTPRPDFIPALLGPFISPGKSIFVFSPVLLLSIWSLIFRFRTTWSAWVYTLLLVVFQALFYDSEWAGHINWGLRYVLPAIPLLALACAPAISTLLKKRFGIAFLVALFGLSFLIQVLASVVPVRQFYLEAFNNVVPLTESSTIWNFKSSIIPWSLNWILAAHPLDLALSRNPAALWLLLPASAGIIALILVGFKFKKLHGMIPLAALLTIALGFGLLTQYRYDIPYSLSRADFKQSQDFINTQYQPGDLVLVKSYPEELWSYWMNWSQPSISWTSLPFVYPSADQVVNAQQNDNPELALNNTTLWIFTHQLVPGRRVWLISDQNSPMADHDFDGLWLQAHSSRSTCTIFSGSATSTRVCDYEIKN